jgi:aminoglycoside phosphotransferase (APT) family kinase protein
MSRRDIYYWKCDRPAAFHGTQTRRELDFTNTTELATELAKHFDTKNVVLSPGAGQGNHLTWNADVNGTPLFIRVENGPEKDGHLAVESALLDHVRATGVMTPRVFGCDASRSRVPFAWQALERIAAPDLNHWFKQGALDVSSIAFEIGRAVAIWQSITLKGFGALDQGLCGYHASYADYFHLRLEEHLHFLTKHGFLSHADEIAAEIENHRALLDLAPGCLVHKDLALWNILGSQHQVEAFIDFDDSIAGDPMDDLSLLACFHDAAFLQRAFEGYQSLRTLPEHHQRRFWLHLLRNMIVKAVIRVGAGYFDRDDGFFLISSGSSGINLRDRTLSQITLALRGLREGCGLDILLP